MLSLAGDKIQNKQLHKFEDSYREFSNVVCLIIVDN